MPGKSSFENSGMEDTLALPPKEGEEAVPAPDTERQIGPYRLLRVIGEGGMALAASDGPAHTQSTEALTAMYRGWERADPGKGHAAQADTWEARAAAQLSADPALEVASSGSKPVRHSISAPTPK